VIAVTAASPRLPPRRLLIGPCIGVILLLAVAALQPYPRWQEGATYCLPLFGPQVSLPAGLGDTARTRVTAHEAVHAAQCRALGSWHMFAAHWHLTERLRLEAEADCAEARLAVKQGRRPDHAFEQFVDDLTYGVPRGSAPGAEAARSAAVAACPDVSVAALQYSAEHAAGGT
jgi:hypothetical protein